MNYKKHKRKLPSYRVRGQKLSKYIRIFGHKGCREFFHNELQRVRVRGGHALKLKQIKSCVVNIHYGRRWLLIEQYQYARIFKWLDRR